MDRSSIGVRVISVNDICGEIVVQAVGPRRVMIGSDTVDANRLVIAAI